MELSIRVNAAIDNVWRALVDPAELTRWCCDHAEVKLSPPGRYFLKGPRHPAYVLSDGAADGWIHDVEAPYVLDWGWQLAEGPSEVEYRLQENGGATELTIRHDALNPPTRLGLAEAWRVQVYGLKRYLERGVRPEQVFYDGTHSGRIRRRIEINASAERVYSVLTDSALVRKWQDYAPGICIAPETAFSSGWRSPPSERDEDTRDRGRAGPSRNLAYTWRYDGDARDSVVVWSLEDCGDKTQLTLDHWGFAHVENAIKYEVAWLSCMHPIRALAEVGDDGLVSC